MIYDNSKDTYTLRSGRTFYAGVDGVLGLGPDPTHGVYSGWDGTLGESIQDLTIAERTEIATEMIGRWSEWSGE